MPSTALSKSLVVLYNSLDSEIIRGFKSEGIDCQRIPVDSLHVENTIQPVKTIVVTGHSCPPVYLGITAKDLASIIALHQPELVVLDTCYGFSEPLLSELAEQEVTALVIGVVTKLPPSGLVYSKEFFQTKTVSARAEAVQAAGGQKIQQWQISMATEIAAAVKQVETWDLSTLRSRLIRILPNFIEMPVGKEGSSFLINIPPQRFRKLAAS